MQKRKKCGKNVFEHTILAFSNKQKTLSHSVTLEEHIVIDQREFLPQCGY